MIARVFDLSGLLIVLGVALTGLVIGAARKQFGLWRGIEAAILAVLGGLMARAFISLLLGSANDSAHAGLAVGWGFFLAPGVVDLFAGHPVLTTPDNLLIFAAIVGAFGGMMSGIYAIYNWAGLGLLAFPLDLTWALAGNTIGCLLHLINIGWGDHGVETRQNAHRYASGFGLRYNPRYAFTQGAVMSNLSEGTEGKLYLHEKTHVWQSRAFGPMYTLTYVGWIVVWVIPAVIAGIVIKGISGFFAGPNNWCYFNNPWETWAYAVQGAARTSIDGVDEKDRKMIWPAKYVIAWSIPFFALATLLAILAVISVWNREEPPQNKTNSSAHRPRAQLSAPGRSLHDTSSLDRFLAAAPGSASHKESFGAVNALISPHGSSRLVSSVALPRSNVSNWRIRHG